MTPRSVSAGMALALQFAFWSASAGTAPVESAYTKLLLGACDKIGEHELGATWRCAGFAGIPVFVSESDLRFFVSYGADGLAEKAFQVTPPPFNSINETLEWRFETQAGKPVPFATILRFFIDREGRNKAGQVLIVTRLGPGETCHIGYVDARARANANALARDLADRHARTFDCESDSPAFIGARDADAVNFWETTVR